MMHCKIWHVKAGIAERSIQSGLEGSHVQKRGLITDISEGVSHHIYPGGYIDEHQCGLW